MNTRIGTGLVLMTIAAAFFALTAGGTSERAQGAGSNGLAGTYVGYSWGGEARGTTFAEAERYIETILTLDNTGTITDARMRSWVPKDGFMTTRQSGAAYVDLDFNVTPVAATPGSDYSAGTSMFTVFTSDMMSFYAVGVNSDGTVAAAIVGPVTRYLYETKLPAGFDYSTSMSELAIGTDLFVPTVRTSGGGLLKPDSWDGLEGRTIFTIHGWSHVVNDKGPLAGVDQDSSVQEYLEALGVTFSGGTPEAMAVEYGYFGNGGWAGNYNNIEADLIGRNVNEFQSLVDWSVPRYGDAVNDDMVFGADVPTGATRTVQNSIDGISGATVRISREATSFQRALVAAGVLNESDVVIGRF